jgi:hypothetical protein
VQAQPIQQEQSLALMVAFLCRLLVPFQGLQALLLPVSFVIRLLGEVLPL